MQRNPEDVIDFIEAFCIVPEGELVGQKVQLQDWQKDFIRGTYQPGIRRSYLSLARKNGKTALISFLVLAHLVGPAAVENSEILSGAQSEDQAAIIFKYLRNTIGMSPELSALAKVRHSPRAIEGLELNVTYKPIASKATTAYGHSPILAILDEVGQVRGESDEFVGSIETAQGAYKNPLLIAISTQAASDTDMFSVWIDDAKESNDPTINAHVYTADPDCELNDESQWLKANPGLDTIRDKDDISSMAERCIRGGASESEFRNLFLNQRIERFDPYINPQIWKECARPAEENDEATWYGGLDLSQTIDLTAYVRVSWQLNPETGDMELHCIPMFFLPSDTLLERERQDRQPYTKWAKQGYIHAIPGPTVNYRAVAEIILAHIRSGKVTNIAFDRWHMPYFRNAMVDLGATKQENDVFIDHGQGYQSMTPSLRALDEVMYAGRLRHGNNPVLTMCAQNSVVQAPPNGVSRKLVKAASTKRIDGMVALTMACFIAGNPPAGKRVSMYDNPEVAALLH